MDVFSNSHHELVHSYNNKTTNLGFFKFFFTITNISFAVLDIIWALVLFCLHAFK